MRAIIIARFALALALAVGAEATTKPTDELAQLRREVAELRAENARLRSELQKFREAQARPATTAPAARVTVFEDRLRAELARGDSMRGKNVLPPGALSASPANRRQYAAE